MTAKEHFLNSPHAEPHRKLVKTEAFREAIHHAMLQVVEAADCTQDQLRGAKAFSYALEHIGDVPDQAPAQKPAGLRHDAYDTQRHRHG